MQVSRGVRGHALPHPQLEKFVTGDTIWCILGATDTRKILSFFVSFSTGIGQESWQKFLVLHLINIVTRVFEIYWSSAAVCVTDSAVANVRYLSLSFFR